MEAVHQAHPFYGVARLALHFGWSQDKARRIRNLAGIRIPRAGRRYKYRRGGKPEIAAPPNILHQFAAFKNIERPQDGMDYSNMASAEAWVQDFSFIRFEGSHCFLAVVLSLETRQVVGWRLGTNHSSELTYAALLDALSKHDSPAILHSDRGSEYLSHRHQLLCQNLEIQLSCSNKSSPWQNGFMERWFHTLKQELPPLTQLKGLAELHEAIAMYIRYYNHDRIHTALGTSPAAYAARLKQRRVLDKVSGESIG
jgi:transposase InsO family protein